MEDLRQASEIIRESEISLQRRCNMLGQHLANLGYTGVEVTLDVKIKIGNDTGKFEQNISGKYNGYVQGNGPASIGGVGRSGTATPTSTASNGGGSYSGGFGGGYGSNALPPSSKPSAFGPGPG